MLKNFFFQRYVKTLSNLKNKMILLNNLLIYITFGILLQFFAEVKSQATFKPDLRMAHSAVLINDKLYILGGGLPPANDIPPKETFLYLDLSNSFNINELKWY